MSVHRRLRPREPMPLDELQDLGMRRDRGWRQGIEQREHLGAMEAMAQAASRRPFPRMAGVTIARRIGLAGTVLTSFSPDSGIECDYDADFAATGRRQEAIGKWRGRIVRECGAGLRLGRLKLSGLDLDRARTRSDR